MDSEEGGRPEGCQVGQLFQLLARPHMLDILYQTQTADQPLRFSEIQATLQISPNTLSDRLKALVAHGFLTRTAYNEIPPRVEYHPTASARDLHDLFAAIDRWAGTHSLAPAAEETLVDA